MCVCVVCVRQQNFFFVCNSQISLASLAAVCVCVSTRSADANGDEPHATASQQRINLRVCARERERERMYVCALMHVFAWKYASIHRDE